MELQTALLELNSEYRVEIEAFEMHLESGAGPQGRKSFVIALKVDGRRRSVLNCLWGDVDWRLSSPIEIGPASRVSIEMKRGRLRRWEVLAAATFSDAMTVFFLPQEASRADAHGLAGTDHQSAPARTDSTYKYKRWNRLAATTVSFRVTKLSVHRGQGDDAPSPHSNGCLAHEGEIRSMAAPAALLEASRSLPGSQPGSSCS
ncbi:hypothetical protein AB1N83_010045 [Pleurotus pulmonarius]